VVKKNYSSNHHLLELFCSIDEFLSGGLEPPTSYWLSHKCCPKQFVMLHSSQVRSLGEGGSPELAPGFTWCWRYTWDGVHGKMTARKLFLVADYVDLHLEKGKAIRVTKTAG